MKKVYALVKEKPAPGLTLKQVSVRRPGPGEIQVKMAAVSLDGSDVHIYEWQGHHPLAAKALAEGREFIVGHEGAGIVMAVGPGVMQVKVGDRVAFESTIAPSDCPQVQAGFMNHCEDLSILGIGTDGLLAEEVLVPAHIAIKLPEAMSFEVGALLEPFGVSLRAVQRAKFMFEAFYGRPGQNPRRSFMAARILVLGGTGSIGMIALKSALALGARQVAATGRSETALGLIRQEHPNVSLISTAGGLQALTDFAAEHGSFDIVIEATGATKLLTEVLGLKVAAKGGIWVQVGLIKEEQFSFDLNNLLVRRELALAGSWARAQEDWQVLFRLIQEGTIDLKAIVNKRFSFPGDWEQMFQAEGKNILLLNGAK